MGEVPLYFWSNAARGVGVRCTSTGYLARKDRNLQDARPEFLQLGVAKRPMQKCQIKFIELLKTFVFLIKVVRITL